VDINLTIIGQTIAMIVFVWFCMKFVWPPLVAMMEERQTTIADGLAAAEKGAASLKDAESEVASLLEDARGQARDIIDQAGRRANDLVAQGKKDGQAEKERQLVSANAEIEQELNRVRNELRGQVSAIAVAGAEKILRREIDASSHQDILDDLAQQI
jgi:F-type H+-transporting ATPase subunit b